MDKYNTGPKDKPKLDWTREQRKEWIDAETARFKKDHADFHRSAQPHQLNSVVDMCFAQRERYLNHQKKLIDVSTPKAELRGDILIAVEKFEEATGVSITSIGIDGNKVVICDVGDGGWSVNNRLKPQ